MWTIIQNQPSYTGQSPGAENERGVCSVQTDTHAHNTQSLWTLLVSHSEVWPHQALINSPDYVIQMTWNSNFKV